LLESALEAARRVTMTSAGAELLARSKVILDEVEAAGAAVRRVGAGEAGTVRLGITRRLPRSSPLTSSAGSRPKRHR
jgi:DNA-binding transcriptional LysR family regulator